MIEGSTAKGFKFSIDEDALNDYDVLAGLSEIDAGNMSHLTNTVRVFLGDEQEKELRKFVRDQYGNGKRTPARAMVAEFSEILNACGNAAKNS